jgi:uncharacterized protein YbjT (DUF2867 family)
MILVIGARSKIGSALIDLMLRQGEEARALVRDSEVDRLLSEIMM